MVVKIGDLENRRAKKNGETLPTMKSINRIAPRYTIKPAHSRLAWFRRSPTSRSHVQLVRSGCTECDVVRNAPRALSPLPLLVQPASPAIISLSNEARFWGTKQERHVEPAAGYRYRNVLESEGGPVGRVMLREFPVYGRQMYQANAWLSRFRLSPNAKRFALYSDADGTGTAHAPMIARYMAISESMERWAYRTKVKADDRELYGFDVDESTNGMAAFPGLFPLGGPEAWARSWRPWSVRQHHRLVGGRHRWRGARDGMARH